jgi:hypothetical protein
MIGPCRPLPPTQRLSRCVLPAGVRGAVCEEPVDGPGRRVRLAGHGLPDEPAERFDPGGWDEDAIKPSQPQCWIYQRDPDFAVKTARVLDL